MANKSTRKPFKSSIPEKKLIEARKMREGGIPYQKIANDLGVAYSTLRYAMSPEARKHQKKYDEENKERAAKYRENNKERIAEYREDHKDEAAQYRDDHREEQKEYAKKYRKDHKNERTECGKKYRKDNRDKIAEYNREYYEAHKDTIVEYYRKYCENNKDELARRGREYRKDNSAKMLANGAKRRALKKGVTVGDLGEIAEIYRQAKEDYGLYCYICGELIPVGEGQVDHIFPVSRHFAHAPFNLIPAHARCNREKHNKMPEDIEIYDRSVVERARRGHNLVLFWGPLKLIIELRKDQARGVR